MINPPDLRSGKDSGVPWEDTPGVEALLTVTRICYLTSKLGKWLHLFSHACNTILLPDNHYQQPSLCYVSVVFSNSSSCIPVRQAKDLASLTTCDFVLTQGTGVLLLLKKQAFHSTWSDRSSVFAEETGISFFLKRSEFCSYWRNSRLILPEGAGVVLWFKRSQLRVYPEGQNYILTQKTRLLISPECSDLQRNSKDRSSRNYIVMLKLLIHWAGYSRCHWHWSTLPNPHLPTNHKHLYVHLTPHKLFTPNNVVICLRIHQYVGMTYEFFLTMFTPWHVGRPWIQWVQRLSMRVHIHTHIRLFQYIILYHTYTELF